MHVHVTSVGVWVSCAFPDVCVCSGVSMCQECSGCVCVCAVSSVNAASINVLCLFIAR